MYTEGNVVHKHLAPYCPKTHHTNVHGCLTTVDITLPGYPTFRIFYHSLQHL